MIKLGGGREGCVIGGGHGIAGRESHTNWWDSQPAIPKGGRPGGRAGFAVCESHTIWWDLQPAIHHPPPPFWIRRLETLGMLLVRIAVVGDLSLFFLEI